MALQVGWEVLVLPDVVELDTLQRGYHREHIARVEPALQAFGGDPIENVSIGEGKSCGGLPQCDFCGGRAVIESR